MRGFITRPIGQVLVAMAIALGGGGIYIANAGGGGGGTPTPTPTPTATAGPVTCNQTITTRAALVSALGTTATSGQTVCVTSSITGAAISTSTDMTSQTRFIAQPNDMTIDMVAVSFPGASKMTFEGFELANAAFDIDTGNDIWLRKNYIHDVDGANAIRMADNSDGAKIIGNRIVNINSLCSSACSSGGYGIRGFGDQTNVEILYNTFDMNPTMSQADNEMSGDGFELSLHGSFLIKGNVVTHVMFSPYDGSDPRNPHADGGMLWGGTDSGTVEDNRFLDVTGTLMSPDGRDIDFTNNLIARVANQCVDATQNGSSGNVVPLRFVWTRNTIEDCPGSGLHTNGTSIGARGLNELHFNVLEQLGCDAAGPTQYTVADHNLVDTNGCSVTGTNNLNFTPTFADTVDYLPTNLPAGYETAGYRDAPAGYLELPVGV